MQVVEGGLEAHLSFVMSRQPWRCVASAQRPDPGALGSWGAGGGPASSAGLIIVADMLQRRAHFHLVLLTT